MCPFVPPKPTQQDRDVKSTQTSPDEKCPRMTSNSSSELAARLTEALAPVLLEQRREVRSDRTEAEEEAAPDAQLTRRRGCRFEGWRRPPVVGGALGGRAARVCLCVGLQVLSPSPAGTHRGTEGTLTPFLSALDLSAVSSHSGAPAL